MSTYNFDMLYKNVYCLLEVMPLPYPYPHFINVTGSAYPCRVLFVADSYPPLRELE